MSFSTLNTLPTPADTPTSMDTDNAPPSPTSYANHSSSWTPVDSVTPISTNPSRKRSRDETAFEAIDAENSYFPLAQQVNPPEPIPEEPIYGEGMVLLNPSTGHAISAESQTGTWYEEKADEEAEAEATKRAAQSQLEDRPRLPLSRKSMRLSQSSLRNPAESVINNSTSAPASPPKSASHPEIDEATLALGIGWTRIASEDPDIQAAARGWARYLENHYSRHIHNAEILLKNRGLDAYLVGCQEGFFLFAEDLLKGQLVGRTWENCLNNLKSQPMIFEGSEVLQAERTPGPDTENQKYQLNGAQTDTAVNGGTAHVNGDGGMDLD